MKKLSLFLLILPLVFVGCGDDDEPDYSTEIVGTWNFSNILSMGFETNNKAVNKEIAKELKNIDWSQVDFGEELYGGYMEFSEDGSYRSEGDGKYEEGTYRLDGDVLLVYVEGEPTVKYTISIKGNILILSADLRDSTLQYLINTLKEEDPEFKSMIDEMGSYGVKMTKVTMSMEFKK